jgi:hypothetical protein
MHIIIIKRKTTKTTTTILQMYALHSDIVEDNCLIILFSIYTFHIKLTIVLHLAIYNLYTQQIIF